MMTTARQHPYHPIIYVRGFAATQGEIEETVADPYMGFNIGSTRADHPFRTAASSSTATMTRPRRTLATARLLRLNTSRRVWASSSCACGS